MKVLIMIPCYNEGRNIEAVVGDVLEHFPAADIVLIDDASTDDTGRHMRVIAESHPTHIRVLSLPFNLGIGGSVQTGIKWAKALDYDAAIQFDGDGQHDARYLRPLLEGIKSHRLNIVIGSRFLRSDQQPFATTLPRKWGMRLFSRIYTRITGDIVTDTTSGLRALDKKAIEYFDRNYPADFPDVPALIAAWRNGLKIAEIPVAMRSRKFGKSSTGFWKSIWYPFKTMMAIFATIIEKKRAQIHGH